MYKLASLWTTEFVFHSSRGMEVQDQGWLSVYWWQYTHLQKNPSFCVLLCKKEQEVSHHTNHGSEILTHGLVISYRPHLGSWDADLWIGVKEQNHQTIPSANAKLYKLHEAYHHLPSSTNHFSLYSYSANNLYPKSKFLMSLCSVY